MMTSFLLRLVAILFPSPLSTALDYVVANYLHFCTSHSMYLSSLQIISSPSLTIEESECVDDKLDIGMVGLLMSKTLR